MVGVIAHRRAAGDPARVARAIPVTATFLAYLLVITATGVWTAWRAIRDKHDASRYTGPVFRGLAWLSLLAASACSRSASRSARRC